METLEFLKTPEEKLRWIASRVVDPRLSQIHSYIPGFMSGSAHLWYGERYSLIEYVSLANTFLEDIEDGDTEIEDIEGEIDGMYEDIVQNNMWGFIFDW